jgi:hypothetical protein
MVLPLLAERGYSAAFFVPVDFIVKEHALFGAPFPCMDWGQIRELAAAGMTVGSFGRRGGILEDFPPAARRSRTGWAGPCGIMPTWRDTRRERFAAGSSRRASKWC